MLNRSASLAMSTSLLKTLPGKLDIKRHSPSNLFISFQFVLVETVTTSLMDRFTKLRNYKFLTVLCLCTFFFLLGLTLTTDVSIKRNFWANFCKQSALMNIIGIKHDVWCINFCGTKGDVINEAELF